MKIYPPLNIALIGTGNRSQTVYRPLFASLANWGINVTTVCDPVHENADAFAESIGVPAFYSLHDLVKARPMEAALVVTPVPSHHSISSYLSQHGIHNMVETSIAMSLLQAKDMAKTAHENNVIFRVAENFFRFPFDRMMQKIAATDFLGPIKRLTCFHDHTGFHNNSRWVVFYGAHPLAVQAVHHTMPTLPHYSMPHRFHTSEDFRAHFFFFSEDRLVVDLAGNIKSKLGRYPRPGYTEVDGARGTIVQWPSANWSGEAEVRYCSDYALQNGAVADQIFPIVHVIKNDRWLSSYVDLPTGRVEFVNPYASSEAAGSAHYRAFYGDAIMDHIVDFAGAVRGTGKSEYMPEDAIAAMEMEVACRESILQNGARLEMPLQGDLQSEAETHAAMKAQYGIDPLDIEGMLSYSYPRP